MNKAGDRLAWRRWSGDVIELINRRSLMGALTIGLLYAAWGIFIVVLPDWPFTTVFAITLTLWNVMGALVVLLLFAAAMTATRYAVPGWLTYPLAWLLGVAAYHALGLALLSWLAPHPGNAVLARSSAMASLFVFGFAGPLYVYSTKAARHVRLFQLAEAERAVEAARLAQEQLKARLASIDQDLVINALRLSLDLRTGNADRAETAETLLVRVTEYLRAAQQRGGTDAALIASTLAQLRQACAAATTSAS